MNEVKLFFLIGLLAVGCTKKSKQDIGYSEESVAIPVFSSIDKVENDLSFVAEGIDIVKLETKSECLLTGQIIDMDVSSEYIFIAEIGAIYQFDRGGRFIRKIGKNGRGPGEYPQVNGMQIDWKRKVIHVFPGKTRGKVMKYDFQGNFSGDVFFENEDFVSFDVVESNYVFHRFCFDKFNTDYQMLYLVDSMGRKTSVKSPIFPAIKNSGQTVVRFGNSRNFSWRFYDQLCVMEEGNDTIYSIDSDSIGIRGVLTGSKKVSLHNFYFSKMLPEHEVMLTDWASMPANSCVFESEKFMIFRCRTGGNDRYLCIYDKSGDQIYRTDFPYRSSERMYSDAFYDDLVSGLAISPLVSVAEGHFASVFPAYELLEKQDEIEGFYAQFSKEETKRLLDVCGQTTPDDNPFVIIGKLR